ncbi:MAG: hypothetical protein K6A65_06260 [Succinivibrionaceae bacterium]|nr:hypothetical protein [Succinivibrionaceae bacterium]
MEKLGSFLLGTVVGAAALGAIAWKLAEDDDDGSVSDHELDGIIKDCDHREQRLSEIDAEMQDLAKRNEEAKDLGELAEISRKQGKLLDEATSL